MQQGAWWLPRSDMKPVFSHTTSDGAPTNSTDDATGLRQHNYSAYEQPGLCTIPMSSSSSEATDPKHSKQNSHTHLEPTPRFVSFNFATKKHFPKRSAAHNTYDRTHHPSRYSTHSRGTASSSSRSISAT
ncbi:hypothetical protein K458DRAFT_6580 [Lentithecium fluviatile CBS 122367]|uniref:Uncharacterized protein n=1 Tax=Lentithecium fluviatile CBS 122367 TaxID=1168545 RepID=A0A6G1JN65_9PLEO|nr:hypothetical protein K458DRAFT_6580 [Lentithecium fluviatile CBS 122367]